MALRRTVIHRMLPTGRGARVAAIALASAVGLAACGGSGGGGGPASRTGGTVTIAQQPNLQPTYILPFYSYDFAQYNNQNWFSWLMWRPLYWYGGTSANDVEFNADLSLADAPQWSADGQAATLHLKDWKWSDGKPVTVRDVEFWWNLLVANKENWANYVAGQFPDNVTKADFSDADNGNFSMTFDKKYDPKWLQANQLSQLWAIPQHAWDKTANGDKIGNYDQTPAGAKKVFAYLDQQAKDKASYASNPLWKVVSGPWKLDKFDSTGKVAFIPNDNYSGPDKPKIDRFEQIPFTSASAEINAVLSGEVDYGYVPVGDLGVQKRLENAGNEIQEWPFYGVNYATYNYSNPEVGPIFKQQYIREVFSRLVDQNSYIDSIYHGHAVESYQPVPASAKAYLSDASASNPYPFDVDAAAKLLTDHGWDVKADGVTTCTDAGTADNQCGADIPAGAKLEFKFQYGAGYPEVQREVETLKADAARVGMVLDLSSAPFSQLVSDKHQVCGPGHNTCPWNIIYYYPGGWYWGVPASMPTGDIPFGASPLSAPGWDDPSMGAAANLPMTQGVEGLKTYEDTVARLAPVLWMPTPPTQISVIGKRLKGATPQDPAQNIYPERWSLSSK
jgi:peptide/nickel transport system substrate-binding protein